MVARWNQLGRREATPGTASAPTSCTLARTGRLHPADALRGPVSAIRHGHPMADIAFERQYTETPTSSSSTIEAKRRVVVVRVVPAWSPDARSSRFSRPTSHAGTRDRHRRRKHRCATEKAGARRTVELRRKRPYVVSSRPTICIRLPRSARDFPLDHLALVDADGANVSQLTSTSTYRDSEPDWQPLCTQYGTNGDDVLTGTPARRRHLRSARGRPAPRSRRTRRPARGRRRRHPRRGAR